MKQGFSFYRLVWAVLFVLFNIIAFLPIAWQGSGRLTPSFWIGYVFVSLMLIGQLVCSYFVSRSGHRMFYSISLVKASHIGLVISVVAGGICMLVPQMPYWIAIIVCAVVLVADLLLLVRSVAAVSIVEGVDKKVEHRTAFVRSLTAEVEGLKAFAVSESGRNECRLVYEATRYSDPMSADELVEIENNIKSKYDEFAIAIKKDDIQTAERLGKEMRSLIAERNSKCRLLK